MELPRSFFGTNATQLAQELERIHGAMTWTQNQKGWHCNLASPKALEQDGLVELSKRHLSFNMTKMCLLQRQPLPNQKRWDRAVLGYCHKTGVKYSMGDLLRYPTLEDRGFSRTAFFTPATGGNVFGITEEDLSKFLEFNPVWSMHLPRLPGPLIPISQLPVDHPVIVYLLQRQFTDFPALEAQLGASFCPELREDYPGHRWTPRHGFPTTPLGRIIFQSRQRGQVFNWQGRTLEIILDGWTWVWHPLKHVWEKLGCTHADMGFRYVDEYATWEVPKYIFPFKSIRNMTLLGYDAAVASNLRDPLGRRYALLAEGAFDAARLGIPAISITGRHLSPQALELLIPHFDRLIMVGDNDEKGREAVVKIQELVKNVAPHIRFSAEALPTHRKIKDAGEMTAAEAEVFKAEIINRF